jgi:DNA polymerase-3 subunit chi
MSAETATPQARHWFYLVSGNNDDLRFHTVAKLVEKAWSEGHRTCVHCEDESQARQIDEILWAFRPDAFIPHRVLADNGTPCPEPVGIQWADPSPADWQTVIVLGARLPSCADRFERLALVANEDPDLLQQARKQYRQLEMLGIKPQVHDARRNRPRQ